jgi:uncharacterized protein (UPF0332 family)
MAEEMRLSAAQQFLADARLLNDNARHGSAVSRAYYATYHAMWGALGPPISGDQWRHLAIIGHFVRGHWIRPDFPSVGPGLFEDLRLPLRRLYQLRIDADYDLISVSAESARFAIETADRTLQAIRASLSGEQR